jgi:CRISPR-associated exonuclease Cas4
MPWAEEDLVPISALQHYTYCPRQCALIHVEQVWDENIFTLRGRRAHERVDEPGHRQRGEKRTVRALPLWSERLGLVGKADVVVFNEQGMPFPVEHKVGSRKTRRADEVQLCAQVLCLEEMFGHPVPEGALFYRKTRRRRRVAINEKLRQATEATAEAVRALMHHQTLPQPVADERCRHCSLIEACMPYAPGRFHRMTDP